MLSKKCSSLMASLMGRLHSRTALPIFAVGAILLATGIYGAWRVHRLHKRSSEILSENVASIRVAEEIQLIVREVHHRLKRHFASDRNRHLNEIEGLLLQAEDLIASAAGLAKSGREQEVINKLQDGFRRLDAELAAVISESPRESRELAMLRLTDKVIPGDLLEPTEEYIQLNEQELDRGNARNQATANRLMFGLLLLGTCGGVAGLIAGYSLARLVNRTIVQLAVPLRNTAGTLSEVAGPVTIAAEPGFDDIESLLHKVSVHVTTLVERLQESERDRLRAEQLAALGQLAAALAHELRNPLTSMKAILQLAMESGSACGRDLEILCAESDRLEQCVRSLLDYARPPRLKKVETCLGELLEQTVELAQQRGYRQGVDLRYLPPPMELTLIADASQLRQVVLNLLLNAIDVAPRGSCVRLECTAIGVTSSPWGLVGHRSTPAEAAIVVRDAGPGLPQELGARIFEPFVTTKETGTGLGLSICKQIVEAHQGRIIARDGENGGAILEVRLPLREVVDDRNAEKTSFRGRSEAHATSPLAEPNGQR